MEARAAYGYKALPGQEEGAVDNKEQIVIKKPRFITGQMLFGTLGFGAIAVYIKGSQNCAADLRCVDPILANLSPEYSSVILILCGGGEFALTSAFCAMDSVSIFSKQINEYSGMTKLIKGGGILLAAFTAALEPVILTVKAYPSLEEGFYAPATWVTLVSIYPVDLYGILSLVSHDWPRLLSKVDKWRGYYEGEPIEDKMEYDHLCDQHQRFQEWTKKRWSTLVPQARNIEVASAQPPLEFLYRTQLDVQSSPSSSLKTIAKSFLAGIGLVAFMGSVTPVLMNTYRFLQEQLADDDYSIPVMLGLGALSITIGFAKLRALFEKTIWGSMSLAEWSLDQDLDYQLHPKIKIASWITGVPIAYFSYSLIKEAALRNFQGEGQQIYADITGYSVMYTHLIFSFHLVSLLLRQHSGHYLYEVQKEVETVVSMTLEEFDEFQRELTEDERELFELDNDEPRKETPQRRMSVGGHMDGIPEEVEDNHACEPLSGREGEQSPVAPKLAALPQSVASSESILEEVEVCPKRWAHKLCSWWRKEKNPEPGIQEKTLLRHGVKKSVS